MCFRPSVKFKLVKLVLVPIHVYNCHVIQHQIYHPMNITQTQQVFAKVWIQTLFGISHSVTKLQGSFVTWKNTW